MLGIISGIEPVLLRVWAVIIWEGGAAGLGPVWANVYLQARILVCVSFQVVDSRSLRTDALIGEFRVNGLFSLKAISSHLSIHISGNSVDDRQGWCSETYLSWSVFGKI